MIGLVEAAGAADFRGVSGYRRDNNTIQQSMAPDEDRDKGPNQ